MHTIRVCEYGNATSEGNAKIYAIFIDYGIRMGVLNREVSRCFGGL